MEVTPLSDALEINVEDAESQRRGEKSESFIRLICRTKYTKSILHGFIHKSFKIITLRLRVFAISAFLTSELAKRHRRYLRLISY